MRHVLLTRFLFAVVTVWAVVTVVFIVGRISGDPILLMVSLETSKETQAQMRQSLGLDDPFHVQYARYLLGLTRLDLGMSLTSRLPVSELVASKLWSSVKLALVANVFALSLAIPLGVIAAIKRGTAIDGMARFIVVAGQALPHFWVGVLLIYVFGITLGVLPVAGADTALHYVLPAFTLGWFVAAPLMRLLRSSMVDALESEYVRVARSKGLSSRSVVWRHALRNALIPLTTYGAVQFAVMISGAVVIEVVFAWPGIGRLAVQSVLTRDFPTIQGVALAVGVMVVVVSALVDTAYAMIDPRIRAT